MHTIRQSEYVLIDNNSIIEHISMEIILFFYILTSCCTVFARERNPCLIKNPMDKSL